MKVMKNPVQAMRTVLCLLVLIAAPVRAEWEKVSDADVAVVYIDPGKVSRDGNLRKVWELQDLKQRDKDGVMSRRILFEYDCKERRNRPISGSAHSEPMSKGITIWSGNTPSNWGSIPPNTVGMKIFTRVCGPATAQTSNQPTIEEMHRVLGNAAREANKQLANTRIDDFTTLKLMTYDRGVPVMTYHYTTNILQATGQKSLDQAARKKMFDYHLVKTCSTQYVPFMRLFGLKVAHRFEDVETGLELTKVTIRGSDCPRS